MPAANISEIKKALSELYLADSRPWLVGFSGGKDSTLVAQLIFDAVQEIPAEQRKKEIAVVCTDTRVEIPAIVEMIETTLAKMRKCSVEQNLNIQVNLLRPPAEQSFWVNIIGRGYPPPNRVFRWCTQRLKIDPVRRLVRDVNTHHSKRAVSHFQNLRATMSTFTEVGVVSAESSNKHNGTISLMICTVKWFFVYSSAVAKVNIRSEICAEVVRLLMAERKRLGISGNSLAEKSGLSQSLISSLETNPWNPTLDTLLRIGEVLQVDVGEIITKASKAVVTTASARGK